VPSEITALAAQPEREQSVRMPRESGDPHSDIALVTCELSKRAERSETVGGEYLLAAKPTISLSEPRSLKPSTQRCLELLRSRTHFDREFSGAKEVINESCSLRIRHRDASYFRDGGHNLRERTQLRISGC